MFWADGRIYKGLWTNGIENAKKLPIRRLTGFAYPRHKRAASQNPKKNAKLPNLTKKKGKSIEVHRLAGSDYEVNK